MTHAIKKMPPAARGASAPLERSAGHSRAYRLVPRRRAGLLGASRGGRAAVYLALACLGPGLAWASSVGAASPAGLWQTVDDKTGEPRAVVRIDVVDGSLVGTLERLLLRPDEGADPICIRCDGPLKGRRVIGLDVLSGFAREGEGAWSGGRLLDPHTGKTYSGRLWLERGSVLKVRAYAGLFRRTQTWRRHSTDDSGGATGLWDVHESEEGPATSQVAIREERGLLYGAVRRLILQPDEGDDPICSRCPGERRGRKIVGLDIIRGHRFDGERWSDGIVLDPESGKEYRSALWLVGDDTLRLRGYVGPFYRTQTWRRVPALAPVAGPGASGVLVPPLPEPRAQRGHCPGA